MEEGDNSKDELANALIKNVPGRESMANEAN
jgi:hypothetical protein